MKKPKLRIDLEPARARALAAWKLGEASLPWLERAHRLAPSDQNLRFSLAARRLQAGHFAAAAQLFEQMALRFGVPECWTGLAACRLALGLPEQAAEALQSALSRNEADQAMTDLASRVVQATGHPGWCGLLLEGTLLTGHTALGLTVMLDGERLASPELPNDWRNAQSLRVEIGGIPLLGSPIAIAHILRVEGYAERQGDQVTGTAWLPAAPVRDPVLRILAEDGIELAVFTAVTPCAEVEGSFPLSRQRRFRARSQARVLCA